MLLTTEQAIRILSITQEEVTNKPYLRFGQAIFINIPKVAPDFPLEDFVNTSMDIFYWNDKKKVIDVFNSCYVDWTK